MVEHITGILALIGVLSLFCQWLGWKLRLPAILPLLLCGLLLGPGLGFLTPDAVFGDLLFPIISLGVAIILFEGALTLNFKEIKDIGRMVTHLVTIGMVATWVAISLATHYFMGFDWALAWLFGALVVVTGPTVIVPMLRSVRPKSQLASILRWEGIVIDPIGAVLAVLVFEYIAASQDATGHILTSFASILALGFGFGAAMGYVVGWVLRKDLLPHYLRNTAVLTVMLGTFVGSNLLQEESGLLTVTVMGIWLANMRGVDIADILEFKETLTVLLISALFILLAARLDSSAMLDLGWGGIGVLAVTMLVARPLCVWISGIGTSLTSREKWFLSWMAPRGIVAAAVSSLFAIKLEEQGVPGAEKIVPLVFTIIIGTVVIQSLTAGTWARILKVKAEPAQGLLMFGASAFSREFAKQLKAKNIKVILADTNWDNIRLARMDNIPVYFGNPASEHAETYLDLTGIGRVLIVSPYRQLNPLVSFYYQDYFGAEKVFGLNNMEGATSARHLASEEYMKRLCLFGDAVSYAKIASQMAKGAVLKSTTLRESFTMVDFTRRYGDSVLPLVYIKNERLHIITASTEIPATGIELISLIPIEAQQYAKLSQEREQQEKEAREQAAREEEARQQALAQSESPRERAQERDQERAQEGVKGDETQDTESGSSQPDTPDNKPVGA